MNEILYLDHHATTPVDPRVFEAMRPALTGEYGNPSSAGHAFGRAAQKQVADARARVARLIGADPQEVIFTSGATESNNVALLGAAGHYAQPGSHILTEATEHKSVLSAVRHLEGKGLCAQILPVDPQGLLDPAAVRAAVTDRTLLISVLFANNEIGTIQPIKEIGRIAKEHGVLFHVDAAQAAGKVPIDVNGLGIDLLSFSAHKMYGPKGIGALYVRRKGPRVALEPLFHGGAQESGLRPGTLNVPAIAGFGKACEIALAEMEDETRRVRALRDRLEARIREGLTEVYVNGHPVERLANNLNMSFPYVDGGSLLAGLWQTMAVSSGSACSSDIPEASYVLKALGLGPERSGTSVRFGLGRFNTAGEIDAAADRVISVVTELRAASPLFQAWKSGRLAG